MSKLTLKAPVELELDLDVMRPHEAVRRHSALVERLREANLAAITDDDLPRTFTVDAHDLVVLALALELLQPLLFHAARVWSADQASRS